MEAIEVCNFVDWALPDDGSSEDGKREGCVHNAEHPCVARSVRIAHNRYRRGSASLLDPGAQLDAELLDELPGTEES